MEDFPKDDLALERKWAEEVLSVSEARYRRLFETAQDGILILDAHSGLITDVNPFLVNLLDYPREEFIGRTLWDIDSFKNIEASKEAFQELQEKEYIRYDNLPLETRSGRRVNVEFVSIVYGVEGKRVIQCNIRDITARKRAEQEGERLRQSLNTLHSDELHSPIVRGIAHDVTDRMWAEVELRRSVERYRSLIMAMAEGVLVLDALGNITMCNPAAERILGLTTNQLIGRTLMDPRWEAIHEDGSPFPVEDQPAILTLYTGQPQLNVCMGIQKPDGTRTWIIANSQALFYTGETIPYSVVISFDDITERKYTEEALRASEKRYRRFVECNTACVLINTLDGRILQANNAITRTLGYDSIQEILARTVPELYADPNDRAVMIRLLKEKKSLSNYELRFKRKDGSTVSTLANISLV
jgi:PAS domain S-box-containing protein